MYKALFDRRVAIRLHEDYRKSGSFGPRAPRMIFSNQFPSCFTRAFAK